MKCLLGKAPGSQCEEVETTKDTKDTKVVVTVLRMRWLDQAQDGADLQGKGRECHGVCGMWNGWEGMYVV